MSTVELYTTNGWTYCLRVKEFLSEREVEFVEFNVEEDPSAKQRLLEVSSHLIIPTIAVGGEVVIGYDPQKLETLLH